MYILYHISYILYLISYILYLISYFLYLISYILNRMSYILYLTSYILYNISYDFVMLAFTRDNIGDVVLVVWKASLAFKKQNKINGVSKIMYFFAASILKVYAISRPVNVCLRQASEVAIEL